MSHLLDAVREVTGAAGTSVVTKHGQGLSVLEWSGGRRARDSLKEFVRTQSWDSSFIGYNAVRCELRAHGTSGAESLGSLVAIFDSNSSPQEIHRDVLRLSASMAGLMLRLQDERDAAKEDARRNRIQARDPASVHSLDQLLESPGLSAQSKEIGAAVLSDAPLLILGESGTGKTALASAIAHASGRRPVVRAVLGASDDLNTITSELFGHERGAFSGATFKRRGLVEHADGGTLILDELMNLPPHAQQLLLDFTQFGTYRPLGYEGSEPLRARVRIIAATNGNLKQAIRDTRFRQDLYFRLSAFRLELPPLRSYRSSVPRLAETLLSRSDPSNRWRLTGATQRLLQGKHLEWDGNIRQLEGVLHRAQDRARASGLEDGELSPEFFGELVAEGESPPSEPPETVNQATAQNSQGSWEQIQQQRAALDIAEKRIIEQVLEDTGGNVSKAARRLGVPRTSLLSRKRTLGCG